MEDKKTIPGSIQVNVWEGGNDPNTGSDNGSMRSLEIHFSHDVEIESVSFNDGNSGQRTQIDENRIGTKKSIVKMKFPKHKVDEGSGSKDGIWIHFSFDNKFTKIIKFVWSCNVDFTGGKKTANDKTIEDYNKQFYFPRPEPPVIAKPGTGIESTDKNPQIQGTPKENSGITIFDNGEKIDTHKIDDHRSRWVVKISTPLQMGEHRFTAKLTDKDGNESEESVAVNYTVI